VGAPEGVGGVPPPLLPEAGGARTRDLCPAPVLLREYTDFNGEANPPKQRYKADSTSPNHYL